MITTISLNMDIRHFYGHDTRYNEYNALGDNIYTHYSHDYYYSIITGQCKHRSFINITTCIMKLSKTQKNMP